MTYCLAAGVTLRDEGDATYLVAPRPLRAVRINRALREVLHRLGRGEPVRPESPGGPLERLAKKGFLEREAPAGPDSRELPTVSVVIPVMDRAGELRRCLSSLQRVRYPAARLQVVVVDDGSRDDSAAVAEELGATVVSSGGRGQGPAAARNRGAAAAHGELLAFIDSDCTASPGWLIELVDRFRDREVAAVGGCVQGMHVATRLDRYEAVMSSLSLGRRERCGQQGDDTFYLPSCNLLVRRAAFRAAGGFRGGMQVGEDVDLTWRLRDLGWKIVYSPRGWVWHEHRNELGAFLRRRFQYGTSEAALHVLHPQRRKKIALPPLLTAAMVLCVCAVLLPSLWALAGALSCLLLDGRMAVRRLRRCGLPLEAATVWEARLRALGSLVYYVTQHAVRYYGLPLLAVSVLWPQLGLATAVVLLGVVAVERRVRGSALGLVSFTTFFLAEHLAYGAGVFAGCLRQKRFGSYCPILYARMDMSFG
ncbi:MAG: mycofactocin biosynthesis glycosyltransferase MftF [Deferrisomatales bacterium]|nr:mycofactocin biosynthesis glycosyltransferase MftF [Deferrisomatales bacterium]